MKLFKFTEFPLSENFENAYTQTTGKNPNENGNGTIAWFCNQFLFFQRTDINFRMEFIVSE